VIWSNYTFRNKFQFVFNCNKVYKVTCQKTILISIQTFLFVQDKSETVSFNFPLEQELRIGQPITSWAPAASGSSSVRQKMNPFRPDVPPISGLISLTCSIEIGIRNTHTIRDNISKRCAINLENKLWLLMTYLLFHNSWYINKIWYLNTANILAALN